MTGVAPGTEGKCGTVKPFLLEEWWVSLLLTAGAQSELEDRHNMSSYLASKRKNGLKETKTLLHLKFSSSFKHKITVDAL